MFGPGITTVFASRWKALWWAGGILLTAYCSVPSADETAKGGAEQSQDVKAAHDAINALDQLNDPPHED